MYKKIINTCLLASIACFLSFSGINTDFKAQQLKSQRVRSAYTKKWPALQELLAAKHIDKNNFDVYLRAFKYESQLELYVKNKDDKTYQLLKTIPICAKSGDPGPKRKQGDGQVPEGLYEISAFNPYSSYHLSLKVSYPNRSDLAKTKGNPGGDIMIHGNCVTIGCIPLENEPIEDVYVLCVEAKNRGRAIHSDIYPFRFTEKNLALHVKQADDTTISFWQNLKSAYTFFEINHYLPLVSIDKSGNYLIADKQ